MPKEIKKLKKWSDDLSRIFLVQAYDGGGHVKAASCPLTKENKYKLIRKFYMKEDL